MPQMINPFDGAGFTMAEMTRAIQLVPNQYGRLNSLGMFPTERLSQRVALVEMQEGELRLLPSRPVGAPATMGDSDTRTLRSFTVPHIPHNDVVTPEEIQGIRAFGMREGEDPVALVMARKIVKMRQRHAQTLEYMRVKALSGITKDGSGRTVYNWFKEFGIQQHSQDFKFGNEKEEILEHCRNIARHLEDNLKGESMTGILCLVSPEFFDKLIRHPSVKDAYRFYQAANERHPMRDDLRKGFTFGGITFEEYLGTVTLAGGATDRLITAGEGIAFPLGTMDSFATYFAPANLMECVGTFGEELYARQIMRQDGTGVDIFTESNPLPIVKRPALTVRLHSSN